MYPDKGYVERIVKKVFYYYDTHAKPPATETEWQRAIESFLEKNWKEPTTTTERPKHGKPQFERREVKEGLDSPQITEVEKCGFCLDLGVIRVIALDKSFETLMLCECSDPSHWPLPKWTPKCQAILTKERCPLEWFKVVVVVDGKETLEPLNEKGRQWRSKIREAEGFWAKQSQPIPDSPAECPF